MPSPIALLLAAAGLSLLTGGPAAAQGPGRGGPPPASVSIAEAQSVSIAPTIDVPGTVISRSDARIASEISGRVVSVLDVGDTVQAGEPIAELDKRLFELEVADNEAAVESLKSNIGFLTRELARFEELARRNATPARTLDEAAVALDQARQDLARAGIALERSRIDLERASIVAPFSGQIVERLVEPGEYVSSGNEVARLVDTTNVEIRARVPVRTAPYVRTGMTLDLTGLGQQAEGNVRTLVRVGNDVTRTFEIRVGLPTTLWVIGTPVRVAVPTSQPRNVIAVPRDALVLRQAGTSVFKINEEDLAVRVQVQTGAGSGPLIEVDGGLDAGDRVVVRGAERLRDGQPVRIVGAS